VDQRQGGESWLCQPQTSASMPSINGSSDQLQHMSDVASSLQTLRSTDSVITSLLGPAVEAWLKEVLEMSARKLHCVPNQ
jgi:hypothetical protein